MVTLLERPGAGEAPRHPPPAQDHCVAAKISHKAPPRPFPASTEDRIVPCRPDGRPRGMSFHGPRRMLTIIKRWEHEDVLDRMQDQLDRMPEAMGVRRQTVEHPFGTLKAWMGATHFLTRTLDKVRTEMSLHVPAYNLKRMMTIFGVAPLMAAIGT